MKVKIRYFAALREVLGSGDMLEVAPGATVGSIRDLLIGRDEAHASALDRERAVRCALDQVLCGEDAVVRDGAEIGFFPPVTGG